MQELGVGVIGCGEMADIHAAVFSALAGTKLVGAFDIDRTAAERLAAKHRMDVFDNADDLLACPEIGLVCVLTRTHQHTAVVLRALDEGKHVFCEKPMALDFVDNVSIYKMVKHSRCKFMVGYNLRWTTGAVKIRDHLRLTSERKILIDVGLSYAPFMDDWLGRPREGGGVIVALGSHVYDLLRFICPHPVSEICCYSTKVRLDEERSDDSAASIVRFANGGLATVLFHDNAQPTYSFEPGQHVLNVNVFSDTSISSRAVTETVVYYSDHLQTHLSTPYERVRSWGYVAEDEHLVQSIQSDTRPQSNEDDGLWASILVEAARTSSKEGRGIDIGSYKESLEKEYTFTL